LGQGRNVDRRSFLAQVAGGALAAAALLPAAPAEARRRRRHMVVDADPRDPARLQPAPPRPHRSQPLPPPTLPNDGPTDPDIELPHRRRFRGGVPAPSRFVICPGNRRCPRWTR
jgi:hypothetical protein